MSKEIVLVGACRTAMGKMGGTLADIPAEKLGAIVMKEAIERAGIKPDMVILSKSIGASMPLTLLLIKPNDDIFGPAEHNGTFRGNQLGFVAGNAGLEFLLDFLQFLVGSCPIQLLQHTFQVEKFLFSQFQLVL